MPENRELAGSATRWGPLFGARAAEWAETWEGPEGWGTPAYEHVLDRAKIASGTRVLDCGCGAGRFARMAADRGASVAGIDASVELIEIAAERTPEGDFRAGDIEALPWDDESFDVVTGFSAFQFADDKTRALTEARRVSRDPVAVVIPTRVAESGITSVFKPVFPLFAPEALESMEQSGMFALSEPGKLEEVLAAAGLTPWGRRSRVSDRLRRCEGGRARLHGSGTNDARNPARGRGSHKPSAPGSRSSRAPMVA